jgi:hypothetical protein
MITLTREEAQRVLDALEKISMGGHPDWANDVTPILRARLAQPEPDYEAEFIKDWNEGKVKRVSDGKRMVPEREWQGLTDEEVKEIYTATEIKVDENWRTGDRSMMFPTTLYKAIEAKLKEKNT